MDYLTFTKVEDKIYPNRQLVGTFFISNRPLWSDTVEVRPLTLNHLIISLIRNHTRIVRWVLLRLLFKCGFIKIPINEAFSWRAHFRWIPRAKYRKQQKES